MHTYSSPSLPTLDELSDIAARNNPARVAFGEGVDGETVTWAAYHERCTRAANALRETVAQGDRVAFLCDCSVDHVTLWDAALKAGCVVSNLHTRAAPETLAYCLDAIRPRVLVVDDACSELVETRVRDAVDRNVSTVVTTGEGSTDVGVSVDEFVAGHGTDTPDVRVRDGDVAAIVWTSGTTGRPKGWCHTHRALGLKALHQEKLLALDRTASQPHVFTPSFAAWYSLVLPALYANASTYFLREWDPEAFLRLVDRRALTSAVLIPTMFQSVLSVDSFDEYDVGSLERVVTSGERLDAATLSRIRSRLCECVYNSYAATEVLGTVITNDELEGDKIESVGKPISGTRVRVVEPGGAPDETVPTGDLGEILVDGPDCAVWAWGRTEATEEAFEDGWWYSGDLGYRDEEGYLYVEGRSDFMIKTKGIKVFPTPIEERLTEHPAVAEAAVVGVDDEEYGQKVVAVVSVEDRSVTADDLDSWCLESDRVARFERPREYRFVDRSLPRTATGKLDRDGVQQNLDSDDS